MTRIALAYCLALVSGLLLADFNMLRPIGDFINAYPELDKVVHFWMYGVLALLANAALASRRRWSLVPTVAMGSLLVMLGSTVEEYTNIFTTSRTWSLGDLAANYLGIVFLGIVPFVVWRQNSAVE